MANRMARPPKGLGFLKKPKARPTGDAALVFADLALGFRDKFPEVRHWSDERFVEAIYELTEAGLAKMRITDHEDGDGFDCELVLSEAVTHG